MKIGVFWDLMPYSLVDNQRFGESCYLHIPLRKWSQQESDISQCHIRKDSDYHKFISVFTSYFRDIFSLKVGLVLTKIQFQAIFTGLWTIVSFISVIPFLRTFFFFNLQGA
jgi:hypothetical protein